MHERTNEVGQSGRTSQFDPKAPLFNRDWCTKCEQTLVNPDGEHPAGDDTHEGVAVVWQPYNDDVAFTISPEEYDSMQQNGGEDPVPFVRITMVNTAFVIPPFTVTLNCEDVDQFIKLLQQAKAAFGWTAVES